MKITYDPTVDAAYIYLVEEIGFGGVASTVPVGPTVIEGVINLDFDAEGRLLGIEVLDAAAKLPAELLAQADPPFSA